MAGATPGYSGSSPHYQNPSGGGPGGMGFAGGPGAYAPYGQPYSGAGGTTPAYQPGIGGGMSPSYRPARTQSPVYGPPNPSYSPTQPHYGADPAYPPQGPGSGGPPGQPDGRN